MFFLFSTVTPLFFFLFSTTVPRVFLFSTYNPCDYSSIIIDCICSPVIISFIYDLHCFSRADDCARSSANLWPTLRPCPERNWWRSATNGSARLEASTLWARKRGTRRWPSHRGHPSLGRLLWVVAFLFCFVSCSFLGFCCYFVKIWLVGVGGEFIRPRWFMLCFASCLMLSSCSCFSPRPPPRPFLLWLGAPLCPTRTASLSPPTYRDNTNKALAKHHSTNTSKCILFGLSPLSCGNVNTPDVLPDLGRPGRSPRPASSPNSSRSRPSTANAQRTRAAPPWE